jgi:riboflavin synthase
MFTGIVESIGEIVAITANAGNLNITLRCPFTSELKIDQSVSHNGVCLTVVDIKGGDYTVTAIEETLKKSNLGIAKVGDLINLERAMKLGDRLDGHIVQGHVDQTGECTSISQSNGSWVFTFRYPTDLKNITVEKGSITVNGVSLTVVDSTAGSFSVAIIPYTYEHTNFKSFQIGSIVNLEFDVIGKYVKRITEGYF